VYIPQLNSLNPTPLQKLLYDWQFTANQSSRQPLETHDQTFFFQLNSCVNRPYVTTSLTRRWGSSLYSPGEDLTETTFSIVTDRCIPIRCRGNPFTEQLPSDSPDNVDMFTGRYQATLVPSRDRYIATAINATILKCGGMD
jgi:hypothetical protein